MITLRARTCEDPTHDSCGRVAIAILEIDYMRIPLCNDCVSNLTHDLAAFNKTIFCHSCADFVLSNSGWHYGGSCKKKAAEKGRVITEENAGYDFCVDCMDTCEAARPTKLCGECKRTDGRIYMSNPPMIRCEVTGRYHHTTYRCDCTDKLPKPKEDSHGK